MTCYIWLQNPPKNLMNYTLTMWWIMRAIAVSMNCTKQCYIEFMCILFRIASQMCLTQPNCIKRDIKFSPCTVKKWCWCKWRDLSIIDLCNIILCFLKEILHLKIIYPIHKPCKFFLYKGKNCGDLLKNGLSRVDYE